VKVPGLMKKLGIFAKERMEELLSTVWALSR
jgi:hypothetical protein